MFSRQMMNSFPPILGEADHLALLPSGDLTSSSYGIE